MSMSRYPNEWCSMPNLKRVSLKTPLINFSVHLLKIYLKTLWDNFHVQVSEGVAVDGRFGTNVPQNLPHTIFSSFVRDLPKNGRKWRPSPDFWKVAVNPNGIYLLALQNFAEAHTALPHQSACHFVTGITYHTPIRVFGDIRESRSMAERMSSNEV